MGSTDFELSRDGPVARKFFASREALIAKEKEHRSGTTPLFEAVAVLFRYVV
jgi:hypothetical protein